MRFNDFNSRVNLPEICRAAGVIGLSFIKVPNFGWYAFNANKTQIANVFQLFKDEEVIYLYRKYTIESPELLEFTILYSENEERSLYEDYARIRYWNGLFKESILESQRTTIPWKGERKKLKHIFEECGYTALNDIKVGLVTKDLSKKFYQAKLHEDSFNQIIIPTYCTPRHACSYELYDLETLKHIKTLFKNGERGWYGDISTGLISADVPDIAKNGGFSWDSKCDLWIDGPVLTSNNLAVSQCIKVWIEAKNTRFINAPLDTIIANKKEAEVKGYLSHLTPKQIQELETRLNVPLLSSWEAVQQKQVEFGHLRFINNGNSYLVDYEPTTVKKESLSRAEFTNFAMCIHKIVNTGNSFYRQGVIRYENKEEPFVFDEDTFSDSKKLMSAIHVFFLSRGLGLPIIISKHRSYLLDVVNSFNRNVKIESAITPYLAPSILPLS